MAPTEHARFSPSSSARWLMCLASVLVNPQKEESSPSRFAMEGTAGHTIAERLLTRYFTNPRLPANAETYIGRVIDGVIVDEELVDAVKQYVGQVLEIYVDLTTGNNADPDVEVYLEETVYVTEHCWGTADVIMYSPLHKLVHVIDLKTGKGSAVTAENNTQLMIYAVGFSKRFPPEQINEFYLHIMMPRHPTADPHSIYHLYRAELQHWSDTVLMPTLDLLSDPNNYDDLIYNPSPKACEWCNHRGQCKALMDVSLKLASLEFEKYKEIPPSEITPRVPHVLSEMTPEERKWLWEVLPMVQDWINSVKEAFLEEMLESNLELPGYKLVESTKFRKFDLPDEEMAEVLQSAGIEPYKKKLISPSQALKQLKKSDPKREVIESHVYKPQGGPTIAPVTSPKPEYNPKTASEEFADYART